MLHEIASKQTIEGTLANKERIIVDLKEDIAMYQLNWNKECQVSHESVEERIFVCEKGTS